MEIERDINRQREKKDKDTVVYVIACSMQREKQIET